jgi:hypothetical protein
MASTTERIDQTVEIMRMVPEDARAAMLKALSPETKALVETSLSRIASQDKMNTWMSEHGLKLQGLKPQAQAAMDALTAWNTGRATEATAVETAKNAVAKAKNDLAAAEAAYAQAAKPQQAVYVAKVDELAALCLKHQGVIYQIEGGWAARPLADGEDVKAAVSNGLVKGETKPAAGNGGHGARAGIPTIRGAACTDWADVKAKLGDLYPTKWIAARSFGKWYDKQTPEVKAIVGNWNG